jgi:hypothetical protein
MKYILPPVQAIIILALNLIAPILVLLALPFVKWDAEPSVGPQRTNPPTPTIMGDFPDWLSWFRTPDQRLPCDTGISECKAMLDNRGKWYTSWIWAGFRNSLMGLAVWCGHRTAGYIPEVEGFWSREDEFGFVWKYTKTMGPIKFETGYTSYALLDGAFGAAPIFKLKHSS